MFFCFYQEKLFCFILVGDGSCFCCDFFCVVQIVMFDWFEVFIEFIYQWYVGWDVQFEDFVFVYVVEVFYQCVQGVIVSGDDYVFIVFQVWQNGFVLVRYDVVDSQCQVFSGWQFGVGQFCIVWIVVWVVFVVFGQFWWSDSEVVMLLFNLFVIIFFSGFCFVQVLQCVVMMFVQFSGFFNWQSGLIQFVQYVLQGVDGMFQYGGISKIKVEVFSFQQFICCFCFVNVFFGQIYVVLIGEVVFVVLLVFVMMNQYQFSYSYFFIFFYMLFFVL